MRRAGLLAVAGVLALAGMAAVASCIVPAHRFDEPPPIDAPPMVDTPPLSLSMVTIPSGVSIQGGTSADSVPVHRVFTSGYEISTRCVTEGEYAACVNAGACPEPPNDGGSVGLGLINVTHASAYCAYLGMRVPTEAELERAHRGEDGATVITYPGPYGLDTCDFGGGANRVIVADGYQCDAYVGRAWANPQEDDGISFDRNFAPGVDVATSNRFGSNPSYGIRCARTIDPSPPPPAPVQPTCTTSCEPTQLGLGDEFGCALRGGGVWCWGKNDVGQLGDSDMYDRMPASRAANPIVDGVAQIAVGSRHACARTTAGAVWCWGNNDFGQLGDGTTSNRNAPVMVATGALDLAAAASQTCIINADATVSCWGGGVSTPAPTGITGASEIAMSVTSTCAATGATVRCWGLLHDTNGVLTQYTPDAPRTYTLTATALAVGDGHACAISGTNVYCWGNGAHYNSTGIDTAPDQMLSGTVAPTVFTSAIGTLIFDQGAILVNHQTGLPGSIAFDGQSIAFTPGTELSGCATEGIGARCWGIEHAQLGRSNGCDPTPATSALALP